MSYNVTPDTFNAKEHKEHCTKNLQKYKELLKNESNVLKIKYYKDLVDLYNIQIELSNIQLSYDKK